MVVKEYSCNLFLIYPPWLFNRRIVNILVAAGAFAPALGGSFIRIALPDWMYVAELIGVILMDIGFLQATIVLGVEATTASK